MPRHHPLSALSIAAAAALCLPAAPQAALGGINTTTSLNATLSNTNFVQTDADALQDRIDAITAEVAQKTLDLTQLTTGTTAHSTLKAEIAQLNATSTALQVIVAKLRDGKEITSYSVANAANGSSTVTVTYNDATTTTATIPAPYTAPTNSSSDGSSSGSSNGSSGSSGSSSSNSSEDDSSNSSGGSGGDILSNILSQALSNALGGGAGGAMGGIQQQLQSMLSGQGSGAQQQQPQAQPPKEEKPAKPACKPAEPATKATTDTAPGKAADDDITAAGKTAGGTTDTELGKAADDSITANGSTAKLIEEQQAKAAKEEAANTLPDCAPPEVNTPNPKSTGAASGSKIQSLEDALAAVGKYQCDSSSNCARNGQQCASLTKAMYPGLGSASGWQQGELVQDNDIPIGTPVATFNYNGNYGPANSPGGISKGSHTGIYLGQNKTGVTLLHQWNGSGGARISTIPWSDWNGNVKEGGSRYYTIANAKTSYLGIYWYVPPIFVSYQRIPEQIWGEGLAKTS